MLIIKTKETKIVHKLKYKDWIRLAYTTSFFTLLLMHFAFPREQLSEAILQALRDENLNDPRERIEIAQSHAFYMPSLLGQP